MSLRRACFALGETGYSRETKTLFSIVPLMSFGNRTGNVEETLLHFGLFSVVSWVSLKSHLGILDVYLYIDGNRCVRIHAYIRAFGRKGVWKRKRKQRG